MATDPNSIGLDKLIVNLKNKLGRQRKVADDTEEQINALEKITKMASDQLDLPEAQRNKSKYLK